MKNLIFLILLGFLSVELSAQTAMSWNIRYNNPNDGENAWENRKEWVANLIRFYEPEVLGIQEGLYEQVNYLNEALPGYAFVGVGRDDGKMAGEYSALFYRTDRMEVLESGTFWLSETPDQTSVGWDASMERISTWAKFRRKDSGQEFWVFNAHLDHRGPESRLNAVKLIYERAQSWNQTKLPMIIMGDLNARPQDPPVQYLAQVLKDSKTTSVAQPFGPEGTFNGFNTAHPLDARIDYIFVNEPITVDKYAVIADTRYQRTPSDHLPVMIYFSLN